LLGAASDYFAGMLPLASRADPSLGNPDPPANLDLVRVRNPRVGLVYYRPAVPVIVDPLGELPERVSRLHVVGESEVRELQ
jgi:hypothetical protein